MNFLSPSRACLLIKTKFTDQSLEIRVFVQIFMDFQLKVKADQVSWGFKKSCFVSSFYPNWLWLKEQKRINCKKKKTFLFLLKIGSSLDFSTFPDRVESEQYTNRQLFLATLFFTTLLFIFPTVIIYYLVFASVTEFAFQMRPGF